MARTSKFDDNKNEILGIIEAAVQRHSKAPTVRELADTFAVAPATMHSWLSKLAEEGLIAWAPGRHRSLRLTPEAVQQLSSQDEQLA